MLLNLLDKIRSTQAEIARLEHSDADKKSWAFELTLSSLQHRFDELEREFSDAAYSEFLDVCSYRLLYEKDAHQTINSIANVMLSFQKLISVVFETLSTGQPRQRGRLPAETVEKTALDFGYSFAGSLGLMFTVPNERTLLGSTLDETIATVFELAKAQDSSAISQYANRLGSAPIKCLYDWASSHVSGNASADIKWLRKEEITADLLIQVPELENLRAILDEASEIESKEVRVRGELVGGDLETRTFHMRLDDAEEIRGHLHEEFKILDESIPGGELPLGRYYDAVLMKQTWIVYSTEQEGEEHLLLSIK